MGTPQQAESTPRGPRSTGSLPLETNLGRSDRDPASSLPEHLFNIKEIRKAVSPLAAPSGSFLREPGRVPTQKKNTRLHVPAADTYRLPTPTKGDGNLLW